MDLSDEQKQRIRDEERRRIAEELYRDHVRRELLGNSNPPFEAGPTAVDSHQSAWKSNMIRNVVRGVALAVGVFAIVHFYSDWSKSNAPLRAVPTSSVSKSGPLKGVEIDRTTGSGTPALVKLTTTEIAAMATPSVVVIESLNEQGQKTGHGSGYVMSDDGTVVTNYHVIRGAGALNVRVRSGEVHRTDSILGYDAAHDVAILRVPGLSARSLSTAIGEIVRVGERVVAIGAPLGLENTVSEGIVSAIRDLNGTHMIQTTASISPGSSGGPLLNEHGDVIGLTTAILRDGQNLNLAVSARYILELAGSRHRTLSEMLAETKASSWIVSSTFGVAARSEFRLPVEVPMQSGATLSGEYTVAGGNNDIEVILATADNRIVVNSGRITRSGRINVELPRGSYFLYFRNQFSTFTPKSVSAEIRLIYYR